MNQCVFIDAPCLKSPSPTVINPSLGNMNDDLLEADLARMEEPMRKLLYATDGCWELEIPQLELPANFFEPRLANRFIGVGSFRGHSLFDPAGTDSAIKSPRGKKYDGERNAEPIHGRIWIHY